VGDGTHAALLLGDILSHGAPEIPDELVFPKSLFQIKIQFDYCVLKLCDGTL
jgi:hypothetical protein